MTLLLILLAAYLIGSIPSALWIGKLFYKKDIRQEGSGNLGTTNTFRVLGKKPGIVVMLMDILKGTAAVLLVFIPFFADVAIHPLLLGIVAVIGHMYPIFASFRGGKAVATSAGVVLGYAPIVFISLAISFAIILKLSKMVSFTSICIAIIAFVYSVISYFYTGDWVFMLMIAVLATFIIYRHRENIARIKNGTESKVNF
ncbi:glycerol-3-phosphate 1-O-acyltransferase PlsY [Caryophanon latum]|uniref:Glycerol-3-phosphate acyltransferase n=1 Tax=Caryophanon latum TaxID=33977 RepID=A0A1C0YU93_9BACL|nr:glycerol-3-phosphate 1-O-acyltransferase PlsY [Caryophanon latum]OCS90737.1 acyl-phosphate glycerol 3-phosphate acyltransferase [Caryophanon latum]